MARRRKRSILDVARKRVEVAERMRTYWAERRGRAHERARLSEYWRDERAQGDTWWIAKGEKLIGAKIDPPQPAIAAGRLLAKSVWGRAWCEHLEEYSDFSNRLPRGRTYLRSGRVLHLVIEPGLVRAVVEGTEVYGQTIRIAVLDHRRKRGLAERCAGTIDAAVDLIAGRLPKLVLDSLADPSSGLFPQPKEIELACTCPDAAYLCKHLAAVLYGVGVRLDDRPELLFSLRGIDPTALISSVPGVFTSRPPPPERRLGTADLASLFDIDLEPVGDDAATDEPLLISRKELIEVGVPTSRIQRWLSTDLLLTTDRRGVYELTPEAWVHLEPLFEI